MKREITFKKIMISTLGTLFVSTGIAFLVNGTYGVDTISTFILGFLNFIEVPFWLASTTFNMSVLLVTYLIDKEELGIGSLINALGIGLMLMVLTPLTNELSNVLPLYSVVAAVLGPLFIGVGGAVYISSGLGSAALEALTNIFTRKTKFTLKSIRMLLDGTLVLIGFILGAPIGVGTIICVVFIGPILEFTLKKLTSN